MQADAYAVAFDREKGRLLLGHHASGPSQQDAPATHSKQFLSLFWLQLGSNLTEQAVGSRFKFIDGNSHPLSQETLLMRSGPIRKMALDRKIGGVT